MADHNLDPVGVDHDCLETFYMVGERVEHAEHCPAWECRQMAVILHGYYNVAYIEAAVKFHQACRTKPAWAFRAMMEERPVKQLIEELSSVAAATASPIWSRRRVSGTARSRSSARAACLSSHGRAT